MVNSHLELVFGMLTLCIIYIILLNFYWVFGCYIYFFSFVSFVLSIQDIDF